MAMETACLHCWHSDPEISKGRWYCCFCDDSCEQTRYDIKFCVFCRVNTTVVGWRYCGNCLDAMVFAVKNADLLSLDSDTAVLVAELRDLYQPSVNCQMGGAR